MLCSSRIRQIHKDAQRLEEPSCSMGQEVLCLECVSHVSDRLTWEKCIRQATENAEPLTIETESRALSS